MSACLAQSVACSLLLLLRYVHVFLSLSRTCGVVWCGVELPAESRSVPLTEGEEEEQREEQRGRNINRHVHVHRREGGRRHRTWVQQQQQPATLVSHVSHMRAHASFIDRGCLRMLQRGRCASLLRCCCMSRTLVLSHALDRQAHAHLLDNMRAVYTSFLLRRHTFICSSPPRVTLLLFTSVSSACSLRCICTR